MEEPIFNTKNLRLARVRYFDRERNGTELTEIEAYAFLVKQDEKYINVFDPTDRLAVYDRMPYPNVSSSGMEYGNRLALVSGTLESGPCYVIERVRVGQLLELDRISYSQLKEYVYNSNKFFVDRPHLLEEETPAKRFKMRHLIKDDKSKMDTLKAYLDSHEVAKTYVKKKFS